MKKATKVSALAAVGLALTVALVGCSSPSAQQAAYSPPGIELGDTVVNPPAELPAAVEQEETSNAPVEEVVNCEVPEPLAPEALVALNTPTTHVARTTASLRGAYIVDAEQLPIQSAYQKRFAYLSKIQLNTGNTVWFGSSDSLNDPEVITNITIDNSADGVVFGATNETYDDYIWGSKAGPDSALVKESTKIVDLYSKCF